MRKFYFEIICILILCTTSSIVKAQSIRYVKSVPSGTGDGLSWVNASGNLQAMINDSNADDEVWVASGIYKPTEKISPAGDDRDKTFILKGGVKIYGGFDGTESLLSERNIAANVAILSGDLNNSNTPNDGDCYHVVVALANSENVILDGFTIQHGFANVATELAGVARNQGAGINITDQQATVSFKNLIIRNNQSSVNSGTTLVNGGAGVYLKLSGDSDCRFENVVFDSNISSASGGNMYFTSSSESPQITVLNCKVFGGRGTSGAGFNIIGSAGNVPQSKIFNTIFSENRATASSPGGGAIYLGGFSTSTIVNCTFYNNSNVNGAISYGNSANTTLNLYNSIFNKNTVSTTNLTAADIRNITGSTLNLRSNLFQSTPPEDSGEEYKNIVNNSPSNLFSSTSITDANFLQLVEGAATEKGNNAYITTNNILTDLANHTRIVHANVDLGAFEYQGTLPVDLEYFTAKKVNNGAELIWKVVTEDNNEKFVIERSNDGVSFKIISLIESKGDTKQTVVYNYFDSNPFPGNNYYRLSQVDKNGISQILGLQVLNFNISTNSVHVYPNPAKEILWVKMNSNLSDGNIRLVTLDGKTLISRKIAVSGAEQFELDIRRFNQGTYLLLIENNGVIIESMKVLIIK
jgi:hypothetical protein